MPVPTTQRGAPIAPYRAVTVAELTSRLDSGGQTALMHVVGSASDALSVEQLLRREGRWGMSPRTRHAAGPTPPGGARPGVAPVHNSAPLVAPPPLHSTAGPRQRTQPQNSRPAGLGPRAAESSAATSRRHRAS